MADERRLTVRLLQQWEDTRKDKVIPCLEDYETEEVKDTWPFCLLVRIENRARNHLMCERMGKEIVAVCGRDLTGQRVYPRTKKFPDVVLLNNLEEVCKAMAPIEGMGRFAGVNGSMVKWRACFMPFANNTNELTHIVVGFSFKSFKPE